MLRNDTREGIGSLERLCLGLVVLDQLVEFVRFAAGDHQHEFTVAYELRASTVRDVLPVLTAARYDLPGAVDVIAALLNVAKGVEDPEDR
jgi:hypothetical protein